MRYKVGVVKKITFLFMTMALAVAMVACQGAVGKTGEPGPKGEPGEPAPPAPPANLAPQARSLVLPAVNLMEDGEAQTVNVGANFFDTDAAEGETLTLATTVSVEGVVGLDLTDGMLTISPMAVGSTVITVRATDAGGLSASATIDVMVVDAGAPMYVVGSLTDRAALTYGNDLEIPGTEVTSAFVGEGLSFSHTESGDDVVVVVMDADYTVTIIARDVHGNAEVTIIATDEDGETASHTITILVREKIVPEATGTPAAVTLAVGGEASPPIDVSGYFSDPNVGDVEYMAESDTPGVATAAVDGSMVTITPEGEGSAMVTVTADNGYGTAMQTISVTVAATPPTAVVGGIPAQTLSIGDQRNVGLGPYFTPGEHGSTDLTYSASVVSTPTGAVTARVSGNDLIIDAVMAGSATITVTAEDGEGEPAMQTVMVTVEAEEVVEPPTPNMAPQLKDGETLGPYKGVFNATATPAVFDFHNIDLSKIFVDDRTATALITYKVRVTSEDDGDDDTTNDDIIAVQGENWVSDPSNANTCDAAAVDDKATPLPDGTNFNSKIGVCYQAVGTATIEVIAVDAEGAESTHSVMFTSHSGNHVPTASEAAPAATPPTAVIVNVADARLKIGDKIKTVIDKKKFSEFFDDNDFPDTASIGRGSEALTFEVKHYYSTVDTTGENIPNALAEGITGLFAGGVMVAAESAPTEIESGKEQARVTVSPTTWTGGRGSTFSVTVEALRGSSTDPAQDDAVAIIATDEFGKSVARVFHVRVNHKPDAYSAHTKAKDRKTLADVTTTKNLTISGTPVPVRLTDDGTTDAVEGYFSDQDGDTLACRYVENDTGKGTTDDPGVATIAWGGTATDRNELAVTPTNVGTMTVDVWCFDQVDTDGDNTTDGNFESSDKATLTVHVQFSGSIQD